MIKTNTTLQTYNNLVERLELSPQVFYSRFGDGDIFIMQGKNEMLHQHSPSLEQELKESIRISHPNYLIGVNVNYNKEEGMYPGVFEPFGYNDLLVKFITQELAITEDITFESAIMPHYLSVFKQDKMLTLLDNYIRPKKKMYVGSVHPQQAERLIGEINYFVETPDKDSYKTMGVWYEEVLNNISKVDVLIPATGIATRVLNKRLFEREVQVHSIDIGSIIDAVASKPTRTWIKKEGNKIHNLLIKQ